MDSPWHYPLFKYVGGIRGLNVRLGLTRLGLMSKQIEALREWVAEFGLAAERPDPRLVVPWRVRAYRAGRRKPDRDIRNRHG